jgi:predicted RNA-binding Zn-ribbon protein involved in translation (DUF1610 family)
MAISTCPVCGINAEYDDFVVPFFRCPRCGNFSIHDIAKFEIRNWSEQQKTNLSGWIRENQECEITTSNLKTLGELPNLTVGEKAGNCLIVWLLNFPSPVRIFHLLTYLLLS